MNASLLNQMSCIDLYLIEKVYLANFFLYSLRKHKWIEIQLSIQCFRRRPQQVSLRPLHCDAAWCEIGKDIYFQFWRIGNISAI